MKILNVLFRNLMYLGTSRLQAVLSRPVVSHESLKSIYDSEMLGGPMTHHTQPKSVQFPNLNGVRFIAAFMVIIHHVEHLKIEFGLPSIYHDNRMGTNLGGLGVTLFFVLSGFLITFLLIVEKKSFNNISLKDFYLRRVLRIWPLYYLVVFLAFYFIPTFIPSIMLATCQSSLHKGFFPKLMMYVFFVPNIAIVTTPAVQYASQAWSIGVEEQFYLIWPLIIKYVKNFIPALCTVIVFFIVAHAVLYRIISADGPGSIAEILDNFLLATRIECMAIGSIVAVLLSAKSRLLVFLYRKPVQLLIYCITGVLVYNETSFPILNHIPYAVLFSIIIVNLASNKATIININWSVFDYLGKISYGLYMFHGIGIIVSIKTAIITFGLAGSSEFTTFDNIIIYTLSIIMTTAIAATSYTLYEKRFLQLKLRFSRIISGDNVHKVVRDNLAPNATISP